MNKERSASEQIFLILMLAMSAMLLYNSFTPPPAPKRPVTPAPALAQAFAGIDAAQGKLLDANSGKAEIAKLESAIKDNPNDQYSYWARLRCGLIEQYALKQPLSTRDRPQNFLSRLFGLFSSAPTKWNYYEEVSDNGASVPQVQAQALYQQGDFLWNESKAKNGRASSEAASTLERLVHQGRGSSEFLNSQILLPANELDPKANAPQTFKPIEVGKLRGTLQNPMPFGILDRVDEYYRTTDNWKDAFFYKLFDRVVQLFGGKPTYSYGLALLFFAVMTSLLLQPLTKKQYDSMKGAQVLAPEVKKIQERYKKNTPADPSQQFQHMGKMNAEIKELYSRHGVNMQAGCLFGLASLPVFFFIVYPLILHYQAHMDLANASFLWIGNLSQPDIALLVMYGISMFLSFRISSTPATDDAQRQTQLMMSFISPVLFPFFLKTSPSAFVMYWMTSNLIGTIFQYRRMKAADPNKSLVKSLFSDPNAALSNSASKDDAIPARPKSKNAEPKSLDVAPKVKTLKPATRVEDEDEDEDEAPLQNGKAFNGSNGSNGATENGKERTPSVPRGSKSRRRRRY